VKHTGQKLGGELFKMCKFWSFLQSKSINNVCKLLQLRLWNPLGDFHPLDHWAIEPDENSSYKKKQKLTISVQCPEM